MIYWTIEYPDENNNSIVETFSEEEILAEYWEYWYGKMCNKYGKEHVDSNYTKQDCIDDWTIVHWAVKSDR